VGGLNVFGFHLVNFFIHYLSSVFLFLFIFNTLKLPLLKDQYTNIAYPVALLATILWSIHPVFVTSVSYIVQRMTSMAGLFYIMSMYFYLKGRTSEKAGKAIVFYLFCVLSGLSSLLTKENAVMLPFSILLFDLLLIQGATKENIQKFVKILILPLILFIIVGALYTGGFTSNVFGAYAGRDFTMYERLLTEPRIIIFYLSLLFYPIHSRLTLLYDVDISHSLWQPWTTLPSIFLILLFIAAAIYLCRKRPLLSFCILFFFLNHLVEGTVIPLELIYEHRNYLPAMFLFIPVAQFFVYVIDYFSYKRILQFAVTIGVIMIIAGLGDVTFRRNTIFSDEFLLWSDNIEKYPNLSRPYSNIGYVYLLHNQKDKAFENFMKAKDLDNFSNTQIKAILEYNLGLHYYYEGQYDLALPYLERAYTLHPSYSMTSVYKANILLLKGEYNAAHALIEPLARKHPENTRLNKLFCLILFKEKKFAEADDHANNFLKRNLFSTFPLPILAEISRIKGNIFSAIMLWKLYQQALPFDPYANIALIELASETNDLSLLDNELARLYCLKTTRTLKNHINDISRQKNLLVYVPDADKIMKIVKARNNINQ
jgi:hypothetical protein